MVLKQWVFSYRGNGHMKYVHEMLHLLHKLTSVWTEKLWKVVTNNWLLNSTGRENMFVEIDLVQEHLNFWIKLLHSRNSSNPIAEFNQEFNRMQEQRKLTPVTDDLNFDQHIDMPLLGERSADSTRQLTEEERKKIEDLLGIEDSASNNSSVADSDSERGVHPYITPDMEVLLMESLTLDCTNKEDIELDMDGWELEPESNNKSEGSKEDEVDKGFE
ncbi:hypothetical protein B0H34DRAFT_679539 [Crassisporium funariophilum]|nr:hypothetical protein B0H34DRAFT_679539 [Crassisporium funariophilum]